MYGNFSEEANSSDCFHDSSKTRMGRLDPLYMTYYYGLFFLVTIVNILGNTLVLSTFYRHRELRTPSNSFICSLAVSDLLMGLLYPVYNISHIETPVIKRTLGQWWMCRIMITFVTSLQSCSSYGLVAIAVSRLVIVIKPLRYRVYLTSRNCAIVITLIYVLCFGVCASRYMIQQIQPPERYCNLCWYELAFPLSDMYTLTAMQFVVPLIIMVTANVWMACTARTLSRRISISGVTCGQRDHWVSKFRRGQKSFAVVTLLVGCFFLSWIPMILHVFFVMLGMSDVAGHEYISATVRIFLYCNYAVNVFIYAGRMTDFREHVRRDLRHFLSCAARVAPTTTSTNINAVETQGM